MLNEKILELCGDTEFYLCWKRFDLKERGENIYKNYNLCKSNMFIKKLNKIIENQIETLQKKKEIEME